MAESQVINIASRKPRQTLEALNRLTGLTWSRIPRSLAASVGSVGVDKDQALSQGDAWKGCGRVAG